MDENTNTVENTNNVEGTGAVTQTLNEEKAVKTFTQEDVNNIVAKRVKGMLDPNSDKYKAFQKWEEDQKTAEEKYAEREKAYTDVKAQYTSLLNENAVLKAGVTGAEDVDYVLYQVSKMEGDFSTNLAMYLKDHPQYLANSKPTSQATGVAVQKGGQVNKEDGIIAILQSRNPNIKF